MTHFRARQVSYIFGLLLLCIYIFALLGMQMFAGQYAFDAHGYHVGLHERVVEGVSAEIPRANFDTLLWVRGSRTRLHGIFERVPQTIANDETAPHRRGREECGARGQDQRERGEDLHGADTRAQWW